MPPSPWARRAQISGAELLLAYIVGVEVECRIADAINPRHYQSGFHSTATIGGLGAAMAVGKILRLKEKTLLHALGIAASMASGLRENFGTMTKPLHAGRAAENGVTAALLAQAGHSAATNILEARRGFFNAMAGGFDESKISGRLGRPYFMQEPGISIKPYPSGSLSHPAQDLILDLVKQHDLHGSQIASVEVGTNANVPNALIYPMPKTALEGKFSIPFCMAIAILERKAGIAQFTDKKVRERKVVALMKRVTLYVDDEMEKLGYDQVRSKIRITLKNGKIIEARADVARGHPRETDELGGNQPRNFMTAQRWCCRAPRLTAVIQLVRGLPQQQSLAPLLRALVPGAEKPARKTRPRKVREQTMESYSQTIGKFVGGLDLSRVPHAVTEKAKLVFLDTLGIALASSTMDFGAMVLNVAAKARRRGRESLGRDGEQSSRGQCRARQRHVGSWPRL